MARKASKGPTGTVKAVRRFPEAERFLVDVHEMRDLSRMMHDFWKWLPKDCMISVDHAAKILTLHESLKRKEIAFFDPLNPDMPEFIAKFIVNLNWKQARPDSLLLPTFTWHYKLSGDNVPWCECQSLDPDFAHIGDAEADQLVRLEELLTKTLKLPTHNCMTHLLGAIKDGTLVGSEKGGVIVWDFLYRSNQWDLLGCFEEWCNQLHFTGLNWRGLSALAARKAAEARRARHPRRKGRARRLAELEECVDLVRTEYPQECKGARGRITASRVWEVMRDKGELPAGSLTPDYSWRWVKEIRAILNKRGLG